ncbi:MAG TPA: PA2169 family four-helix-bundle protein [Acidobacteriaceae bacterium]
MMANDDKAIRNLIRVLRDSEKGFADVGEHIRNPEYKRFFLEESRTRGSYAMEIEKTVNWVTRADLHETGTVSGALHRVWGDIKAHLGASDHSLLETAEQGEDVAKKAYQEALDDLGVSDTLRALIAEQAEHVRRSHDRVKALRDGTVAASDPG